MHCSFQRHHIRYFNLLKMLNIAGRYFNRRVNHMLLSMRHKSKHISTSENLPLPSCLFSVLRAVAMSLSSRDLSNRKS